MAEPTELRPLKRSIPPDLQKQVEDIKTKVPRTTGPPGDLDEEKKRWLIVGICLHSIISPLLRTYVDPIISNLYNSLVSSDSIDTQGYHRYLKKYPATNRYFLNYESINNNRTMNKNYRSYDYRVTSHVDLSKLFLQPNMAHYSGIDGSCDSSALLGMVINISLFPRAVQTDTEKIRSDIRNPWAHCDFTKWTTTQYTDAFQSMGQLVKDLGLSSREENIVLGELKTWATNGHNYLSGTVLGLEIVENIRQQTHVLSKYVQTLYTEADSQFIKVKKELKDIENSLQNRIKKLENLFLQKTMDHEVELKRCSELATSNFRKIESIEAETKKEEEDNIPKNIRAQHNQDIKDWENDESTFLKTRSTYHILKSIPSNNCIIVTGSSGCGKSSNIHHAALQLRDSYGYVIIPVLTGPLDIINYYNENTKQVFVVDDICGKESINKQTLKNWMDNSERLEKIFKIVENETNSTFSQIQGSKLMISCRLHIYKEEQFQLVKLLTRKECNLLSPDMCLLQEERKLMLKKYIPKAIIDSVMKVEENVDFFPLLCKLAKGKTSEEVIKLFTAPVDSITENINHIALEKKEQFCALVLCLLYDDVFNTDWLQLKSISEQEKKDRLADIVKEFEIDLSKEMSRNALKSGFTTLEGTYLKKISTKYSIIHDKIHEMAAVNCGQHLPECFIKHAPPEFIRDHFIFKSVMEGPTKDNVLLLSIDTEEEYFERLLSDLKKFIIVSTFQNKQLKYQPFRAKLISFFRKSEEAKKILKIIDSKGCIVYKADEFFYQCVLQTFTTPLMESASFGYLDLVQFLVDTVKCKVNFTDGRNRSSLYKASEGGKTDVAKFLCENNASVSQCNTYGQSPLYVACKGGHAETVNMLLQHKADVCQGETLGCPLHVACAGGYADIVKSLWEYSTDVLQRGLFGVSYLECLEGHIYTEKLFHKKKANSHQMIKNHSYQRYPRRESPLYMACKGGHVETVKLLLKYNYDVTIDKIGETPLFAACAGGHTEIVKMLLDKKADISQGDSLGNLSKLYVACAGGHTDFVKLLLQRNDDVHQFIGRELLFSLYIACQKGHTDIVEQLLMRKVDLSITISTQGDTPLFVACSRGHINTVNLLLQNNADVSQCNIHEVSPLHVACEGGYTDTAKLLLQNSADVSKCNRELESPLYMASARGHTPTVSLLLHNNADVSQCNINEVSPLHVACKGGFTDTAELLLQNNADVAKCNDSGESPLYEACRGGHVNTVKLLLLYNASVSQCDKLGGRSPLHIVCDRGSLKFHPKYYYPYEKMISEYEKKKDHIEIVKLLIPGNADVNLCDKEAHTPLDIARNSEFSEIVTLLEESLGLQTPQLK